MFTELVGDVMDIDAFAEIDVEAKVEVEFSVVVAPLMTTAAVVPLDACPAPMDVSILLLPFPSP